jgi:hypothetical protein
VSAVLLYGAIQQGLLFRPDMQVSGNGSTDTLLRWYADRVSGDDAGRGRVSLPLWFYRGLMLLWALWLAASLVRGVRPRLARLQRGGLWRPLPKRLAQAPKPADARAAPVLRRALLRHEDQRVRCAEGPSRSSSPTTE